MIYIVGAGPGDPELLTIKAHNLLSQADVVIYTGSLINPDILRVCKPAAKLLNSAPLALEEIIKAMTDAYQGNLLTVRLHTGDPCLYGAIGEQMAELDKMTIPYSVVPGVSSYSAAAAALKKQYTVPDGSQTVIITRLAGRTPVPETESLNALASHRSSMAVFLSAGMTEQVQRELEKGYPGDTPVALVYKVSWPGEKIVRGRLNQLAGLAAEHNINSTALILVGDFLEQTGRSKLYQADFKHDHRE